MTEILSKYGISLEDLIEYTEGNLEEAKVAQVKQAIESEEEIRDIYEGFVLMKEDNAENSLNLEIDQQWKSFMNKASDEGNSENQNSVKDKKTSKVRYLIYPLAAILVIGFISVVVIKLFSTESTQEIATSILDNAHLDPGLVRGESDAWKEEFLNENYQAVLEMEGLDTTQQENVLFFAGISCLLTENKKTDQAIVYFDRVRANQITFYDQEAIFYAALAYIFKEENETARNLLEVCELESEKENINQLLEALNR